MVEHWVKKKRRKVQERTELNIYGIEWRVIQRRADVRIWEWTLRGRGNIKWL